MKQLTYILILLTMSCSPKETTEDETAVFEFPYIKLEKSDGNPMDSLIAELSNMKRPLSIVRECGMPKLEINLKKGLNQNGHNLQLINTHLIAYGSKNKGVIKLECGSKVTIK